MGLMGGRLIEVVIYTYRGYREWRCGDLDWGSSRDVFFRDCHNYGANGRYPSTAFNIGGPRAEPNIWMYVHLVRYAGALPDDTSRAVKHRIGFRGSTSCRLQVIEESPEGSLSASGVSLKSIHISPSSCRYFIPRGEVPPWRLHDYR